MTTTRYAIRIDSTNRHYDSITRYLCRCRGRLFAPHATLERLVEGGNLATYSSPARARATYIRFLRNGGSSCGATASFEVIEVAA